MSAVAYIGEEFEAHRVDVRILKVAGYHVVDGTKGGTRCHHYKCHDWHWHYSCNYN